MKKRNIFQNRSQQLLALFEKAGNRLKMMCVPIDYAKKDHTVIFFQRTWRYSSQTVFSEKYP